MTQSSARKLKPLQDRVLFERVKPEQPDQGFQLLRPEPSMECKVLAVGPKVTLLKAGDRVIIPFNYGYPLDGVEVCREMEVFAVLS